MSRKSWRGLEQGRILITNILERVLRRDGVPVQRIHNLVDQSDKLARRNIIQKTPKLRSLIEEWEASLTEAEGKEQGSG
jgi:cysteinyl-tRNA synthetase